MIKNDNNDKFQIIIYIKQLYQINFSKLFFFFLRKLKNFRLLDLLATKSYLTIDNNISESPALLGFSNRGRFSFARKSSLGIVVNDDWKWVIHQLSHSIPCKIVEFNICFDTIRVTDPDNFLLHDKYKSNIKSKKLEQY